MKISLKLVGLERLTQRLTKALPEEIRKEIWKGIKREAGIVHTIGRLKVPKRTGTLLSRVQIKFQPSKLSARVGVFRDQGGDKNKNRAHIARFLEFGVQAHSVARGADASKVSRKQIMLQGIKKHPGFPAKPWLLGPTLPGRQQLAEKLHGDFITALKTISESLPLSNKGNS
jgi:hypothetical protein